MTPALQSSIHLHKRYICMLQFIMGGGGQGGEGISFSSFLFALLLASVLLPCMEMVYMYMYTQLYIRSFYNTIHV